MGDYDPGWIRRRNSGNMASAAWGVTGPLLAFDAATLTDTSSAGTVATAAAYSLGIPTLAASAATTYTAAATVYIAGAPTAGTNVTITDRYGLWNVGGSRFDGNALFGGLGVNGTGFIQLAAGTTAAAGITLGTDFQFYRSAAGNAVMNNTVGGVYLGFASSGTVKGNILVDATNLYLDAVAGSAIQLRTNGSTTALILSSTLAATFAGAIIGSTQALSGAGAANVTTVTTKLTSTGVGNAITLADGADGQIKTIIHDVDGGSSVLTPTTKTGFSTITFTAVGETATLQFATTRGWFILATQGAVVA